MAVAEADLSEFEAASGTHAGCWFSRLTEEQREKVGAAHGAGFSSVTIAKVVSGWGVPIKRTAVSSHLRGDCSCD